MLVVMQLLKLLKCALSEDCDEACGGVTETKPETGLDLLNKPALLPAMQRSSERWRHETSST